MKDLAAATDGPAVDSAFTTLLDACLKDAYAAIWFLDETTTPQTLVRLAEFNGHGIRLGPHGALIPVGEGIVGGVLKAERAVQIHFANAEDYEQAADPAFLRERGLVSVLGLPFRLADAPGGALIGVGSRHEFTRGEQGRLLDAARLAAAQLVRLRREQTGSLSRRIAEVLSFTYGDTDLPTRLAKAVRQALVASDVAIALWHGENSRLALTSRRVLEFPSVKADSRLALAANGSRPRRWLGDSATSDGGVSGFKAPLLAEIRTLLPSATERHHLLLSPIRLGSTATGVILAIKPPDRDGFLPFEADALYSAATQLGGHLERWRSLDRSATLLTIGRELFEAPTKQAAAESALLGATELLNVQRGFVLLHDSATDAWAVTARYAEQPVDVRSAHLDPAAAKRFRGIREVTVEGIEHSHALRGLDMPRGWSEVKVPLLRDDRLLGILLLQGVSSHQLFEEWDFKKTSLHLLAGQLALVFSEKEFMSDAAKLRGQIDKIADQSSAAAVAVALSHEVKGALATIGGCIEVLRSGERRLSTGSVTATDQRGLARSFAEALAYGVQEIDRLTSLTTAIRSVATGLSDHDLTPTGEYDANDTCYLSDAVEMFTRLLDDAARTAKARLRLSPSLDPRLTRTYAVSERDRRDYRIATTRANVAQIVINLVNNAIDASYPGGRIDVTTSVLLGSDGPRVALAVRDFGVGMSDEVRRRALDMFYTTKATGTGIGLSVVASIAARDGATLDITSSEGKGTTVAVVWPLLAPERKE